MVSLEGEGSALSECHAFIVHAFICINFLNTGLYFFDKCIVHLVKFVSQDYVLQWKYDLHNFNILLYLIEDIYTVLEKSW